MLTALTDKLSGVFRGLSGRGRISEENVRDAMRDVRTALLEADVNFKVVKDFTDRVMEKAQGQEVIKSLKPGEVMVKIVYDDLFCSARPHHHYDVRPPGLGENDDLREAGEVSGEQGASADAGGGGFAAAGGH